MILKRFLGHFEIQTATSSIIDCEFEFDVIIIRLPCVEAKVSPSGLTKDNQRREGTSAPASRQGAINAPLSKIRTYKLNRILKV